MPAQLPKDDDDQSWLSWRRHVLHELKRMDEVRKSVDRLALAVNTLKIQTHGQAAVFGAIGGAVVSGLVGVAIHLLFHK